MKHGSHSSFLETPIFSSDSQLKISTQVIGIYTGRVLTRSICLSEKKIASLLEKLSDKITFCEPFLLPWGWGGTCPSSVPVCFRRCHIPFPNWHKLNRERTAQTSDQTLYLQADCVHVLLNLPSGANKLLVKSIMVNLFLLHLEAFAVRFIERKQRVLWYLVVKVTWIWTK